MFARFRNAEDQKKYPPGGRTGHPVWLLAGLSMFHQAAAAQPGESMAGVENWFATYGLQLFVVIVILGIVASIIVYIIRSRMQRSWDMFYHEPDVASSKYEQLMAEIQGLSLRVQGGESKGYFRKIETLLRVYLERLGCDGARQMAYHELDTLFEEGTLPHGQNEALKSIMTRCRDGALNENRKLDYSASGLLKDLRRLIMEVDDLPVKGSGMNF
jgi:hypothetical protein